MFAKLTIIFVTSSLISVLVRTDNNVSRVESLPVGGQQSTVRSKWISEMLTEVEMSFNMSVNVSAECKRDFGIYKQHVRNQTVWAIRMMESSEWPRTGLFSGVTTHLGHYAECLRSEGSGIYGKYCLAQATYDFDGDEVTQIAPGWTKWAEEDASAWKVIKTYEKNPFRKSRRSLIWAMCIPSSCTATDLQTSLNNALQPVFKTQDLDVTASVDPTFCTTKTTSRLVEHFNIGSCTIGMLILLMVSSTIYDLTFRTHQVSETDRTSFKLVNCFSALQNYKSLFQYSPNNTYTFLYFLTVVFHGTIIWGHATAIYYMFPKYEIEEQEMTYRPWSFVLTSHNFVNAFIMLSGFLTAVRFNFNPEVDGSVQFLVRSLTMKWLRMVPLSGLAILGLFFMLPFLDDGPLLNPIVLKELKYCTTNWWTNMLAMQNVINPGEMCHPHSWCIAADIQLFAIGTVLMIIFRKNRKYGLHMMILTFLYCTGHSFVQIYSNASYKVFTEFFTMDVMDYRKSVSTVLPIHTTAYYRTGAYLTGIATAFLIKLLMDKSYKFSRMQSIILTFSSFIIGFGGQSYALLFFMPGRQNYPLEIAVYGVIQPILSVLPWATLICIHFVSGFGSLISSLFELKLFIPLGKISYSWFLVNLGVQSYHILSQRRTLPRFSSTELLWWMIGDIFIVLATALLFYFSCEAPVNNLINLFARPYLVRKRSETQEKTRKNESTNSGVTKPVSNAEVSSRNGSIKPVRVRKPKPGDHDKSMRIH